MWQGALRDPDDRVRAQVVDAIEAGRSVTVELLYSDQVGRQRTISRFGLIPTGESWLASLSRHWYLDWDGPRPEDLSVAAAQMILRERDAATERRAEAVSEPAWAGADGAEDAQGGPFRESGGPELAGP
jgi:hypothetical protein